MAKKQTPAPPTSPQPARKTTSRRPAAAAPAPPPRATSPAAKVVGRVPFPRDVVRDEAVPKTKQPAMPRQPGFKVRATAMGYHNDERKRAGDVFTLNYAHEFSKKWMERVDARTPHRATTGQDELRKAHDETLKQRASSMSVDIDNPEGGPDPIGANSDNDE